MQYTGVELIPNFTKLKLGLHSCRVLLCLPKDSGSERSLKVGLDYPVLILEREKMKPAILILSLGISMAASPAFADQCTSGANLKINQDYRVLAPEGYRFIEHAGSVVSTAPIQSALVVVSGSNGSYSPGTGSFTNVIAQDNIVCGYKVGESEGDDSWAFLLEKTATVGQSYDLVSPGWYFDGKSTYYCYPEAIGDCSFNSITAKDEPQR